MGRALNDEEVGQAGVSTAHEELENGELRFRLRCRDGSAYIRTVAAAQGGWQAAHSHCCLRETYVVQEGWMALAELHDGTLRIRVLLAGAVVTVEPGVEHTVYLPGHAVIHTVKHGLAGVSDWRGAPRVDELTAGVREADLLRLQEGEPL